MKHHPSENFILQKSVTPNNYIEINKLKVKKNHCVKLQPMNLKSEKKALHNAEERKTSQKLNSFPPKLPEHPGLRNQCSKIPVLQRKPPQNFKKRNEDIYTDTTLSAADKRQKFHQSRLRVVVTSDTIPCVWSQNNNQELLPLSDCYVLNKNTIPPILLPPKNILPPIKPINISTTSVPKRNQSRGLIGEITHFPALCNNLCPKKKNFYTSTVPHLPHILPLPAAPPPSISSSVEQDRLKKTGEAQIIEINPFSNSTLFSNKLLAA